MWLAMWLKQRCHFTIKLDSRQHLELLIRHALSQAIVRGGPSWEITGLRWMMVMMNAVPRHRAPCTRFDCGSHEWDWSMTQIAAAMSGTGA